MPIVEVPGQGNVEFPDTMSDEAIATAIRRVAPPSYPTPKLPAELAGTENPLVTAAKNVPTSAMHAIQNPYGPGVPQGNPTFEGDYHGPTPESVGSELKGMIPHPVEDPVGTALQIATLGKYRRPIGKVAGEAARGAVEGATTTVPMKYHGVGLDVPLPVAGAAAGGFAGWLTHVPYANEVGAALGAAAPIVKSAYERGREAVHGLQDRFQRDASRQVIPMGEEAPAARTPVAPVVDPEQAVMPPVFKNKSGVNTEPVFQPPKIQTPQEAASHNEHLPTVTQADEFGKMPAPNPVAPQVQPPAGNAPALIESNPTPVIPPANLKVSGGETPSGPEVIKPGSQPPGEELIPKTEKVLSEVDKKHEELKKLFEEYKKKHPSKK